MNQITELSHSDESLVVSRILKTVQHALKRHFSLEVDIKGQATKKEWFVEGEVTAITNLGGIKAPLPPLPNVPTPPKPEIPRKTVPPPFLQNDTPENSAFAISGHGISSHSRIPQNPESSFGESKKNIPTSAFGSFISEDNITDVSNIQPIHEIKRQLKHARRKKLLKYALLLLILSGLYLAIYFHGLESIIAFFKH